MAERNGPSRRDALFGIAGIATGIGLAKAPLLAQPAQIEDAQLTPESAIDWRRVMQGTIDADSIGMRAGGNPSANARALTEAWYKGVIGHGTDKADKIDGGLADPVRGTALRFGPGEYRLADFEPLDTDGRRRIHFTLIGIPGSTRIMLEEDQYLLDLGGFIANCLVSGIQFVGGRGFLRMRPVEGNQLGGKLNGGKYFQHCSFQDYSVCAIAGQSTNDPGYQVDRCKFTGLAGSKGLAIPGGGNHVISNNWFSGHERYSYHLIHPNRVRCTGNRHGRGGVRTPYPRHDVWIEPATKVQSAKGLLIDDLHGGEQDGEGDCPILIAQSDISGNPDHETAPDYGTYRHSETPVLLPRDVRGATILGEYTARRTITGGLIKSYSQYIAECTIAPRSIEASFSSLVHFAAMDRLASTNDHAQTNRIEYPPEYREQSTVTRVANLPGFGMARDSEGLLVATRPPGVSLTAPDGDTIMLASLTEISELQQTGGISAQTDDSGIKLTFRDAAGRAALTFPVSSADLDRVCCLSFRLGGLAAGGMQKIKVRIGLTGNRSLRTQLVEVGNSARTVRIPFLLNDNRTSLTIGFDYPFPSIDLAQRNLMLGAVQVYQL